MQREFLSMPYFTFAYTKVNGKKATKENVFLKPADDTLYFQDKMIPYTDLKEGDAVWIRSSRRPRLSPAR